MKKITAIIATLLVLCLLVGVATATDYERITNGNFLNGLDDWTKSEVPASGSASVSTTTISGVSTARFSVGVPTSNLDTPKASISQSVDLTNVNSLTWKTMQGMNTEYPSPVCLYIYKGATQLASYTYSQLGSTWTSKSYDVSGIDGEVTIKFEASTDYYSGMQGTGMVFYVTDISAIATITPPSASANFYVDGSIDSTPVFKKSETATLKYSFSKGSSSTAYAILSWGDGNIASLSVGTDLSLTHTYDGEGKYDPYITIYDNGVVYSTVDLPDVYIISVDFSASTTSADPGTSILFTADTTVGGTTVSTYSWNFGDSQTGTGIQVYHTYQSSGTYDVSLTVTLSAGSGYTYTVSKEDYITTASQTVSFSSNEVQSDTDLTVSWSLRESDFPYNLYVYPSSNAGIITDYSYKYTAPINSASGTTSSFRIADTGYYTAIIQKGQSVITQSTTALQIYKLVSFTVNIYNDNVPFTSAQTTVKLYKADGTYVTQLQTVASGDTYSNSVTFTNVKTGDYYIVITASGQNDRTSPTVAVSETNPTMNIDFTLGTSDSSLVGSGSQYATTFVTFRTQDSGTGRYIQGVQIVAEAVKPTNAWEYFANIFGASLGTVIQSMKLDGISDEDGRITFAMYQNVRYKLNITYLNYHEERSFQQSAMSGEYLISIPVTNTSGTKYTEQLVTEVKTDGDTIIANFTDNSGTVTACTITVYKKNGEERQNITAPVVISNPPPGVVKTNIFTPTEPSGQSYIVSYVITSSKFGTKTQEYGVTFSGVAIKLGDIPNGWYIWISLGILLMTGAVATFVNSRHFAIVVCVVATLLFFAGWLNQLGAVAPIALCICYVLTIVYYIANNHNGGV